MSSGFNAAPSNASLLNGPGNQLQTSFGPGLGNVQRTNSLTGGFGPAPGPYGTITPAHRLKYNQMFKANDFKKAGFLSGRDCSNCAFTVMLIVFSGGWERAGVQHDQII